MDIPLNGKWRYHTEDSLDYAQPEFDDAAWRTMSIPRNWFMDGLDHHGVVWFRTAFSHGRAADRTHVTLHFEGVDYFCDVYLNGSYLGHHQGYFEPFNFDATHLLIPGRNVLAVRVDSPYETPGPDGWHMRKKLIKGVLNHHDCRPGGGWEPVGQAYNTGGIWNRVHLEEHGPATITRIQLSADLESDPPALKAEVWVRNRTSAQQALLRVVCDPDNFRGRGYATVERLSLPAGESLHQFSMEMPEAARWQPWDRGFPHLYEATVRLDADTNAHGVNIPTFGFRTVHVDRKLNWRINGDRYYVRGSNYIASQWLSETLFEDVAADKRHPFGGGPGKGLFAADVDKMRAANLNLVRVHANVLPREFYQACDRAGILVWQDFPLQWGYTDEPYFHDEAERQIKSMAALLFNHPSIVAWCCHNESPSNMSWLADVPGVHYDPRQNRALDIRLEKALQAADATRYVHKASGSGDGHAYPGWYWGHWRGFKDLPGAPFISEYGAQGLPSRATLRRTFKGLGADAGFGLLLKFRAFLERSRKYKELRRTPREDEVPQKLRAAREAWLRWRFHNFQPFETFRRAEVDPGRTLDEFIANSQAYQEHLIQYGTESYRRAKYAGTSGVVQFDFVDPWPAITWSVLDYWRAPKPGYDALRRSMQPVLPTFRIPEQIKAGKSLRLDFQVVNDLRRDFPEALCTWKLERNKKRAGEGELALNIPADGVSDARHVTLPAIKRGTHRLSVSLASREGKLIGQNHYDFEAA